MNIPWDKIIEMIIKLIEGCGGNGEEVTVDRVMAQLQNPGPWTRVQLQREVRKASGLSRSNWLKKRRGIMEEVYEQGRIATHEQIEMLIDEAIGTQ